ncbi:MAG: hypothetical protein ABIQ58_04670 [Candidatus Limnocylindrales bacterium]
MGWTWVLRSREIENFRSCRRQWDLGAIERRGLVPVIRANVFNLEAAVRMGLAVYYFPALDDWNRQIVRPLALKGFNRAMSEQASAYEKTRTLTPELARDWQRHRRLGEALLARYFDWADAADDSDSLFSDELIWTPVPDPDDPVRDLGLDGGRPIRFVTRIDQLVSDPNDEHWIVEHRVAFDDFAPDAALIDDDEQQRAIWAIETAYPQLLVSGTIYNELLVHADDPDRFAEPSLDAADVRETRDMSRVRHPSGAAARQPVSPDPEEIAARSVAVDRVDQRAGTDDVRRSVVRRSRAAIEAAGQRVARDIRQMIDPGVDIAPNPSAERCPPCPFLLPCTTMQAGGDPDLVLLTEFRRRGEEELDDAGLRHSDERREQQGRDPMREDHVNFRWS